MPGYVLRQNPGSGKLEWRKLYDAQVQVGSTWRRVSNAYVKASDGKWHPFFKFVANVNTVIDISSSSGLSITDAPNTAYTVSGTMRNADTRMPLTSGLIVKMVDPSGNVYASTTTDANGAFTLSWKPTKTGSYSPSVSFGNQTIYLPSSWSEGTLQVSSQLVVSVNWPSRIILGQTTTFSGTVKSATGEAPSGTVSLMRSTNGTASTMTSGSISSTGTFSVSVTPDEGYHDTLGYYFRINSGDTSRFPVTWGSQQSITGYQPTPGTVSQSVTSITNTQVKIKVEDQAFLNYFIVRCTETGSTVRLTSSGTAGSDLTATFALSQDTTYHFTTTAYSDNPSDGNTVSGSITVVTGHAAVTDSGSGTFTFNCSGSASWRSADGWSNLGSKLAQGYYSTGSPYYGVASFDASAMVSAINQYGDGTHSSRADNLSTDKLEVYTSRVADIGVTNSGVDINFYCSSSMPNSGTPSLGSSAMGRVSGPAAGAGEWDTLPSGVNSWFNTMLGSDHSLIMYANNSSQYSQYYGGSSFKIRATVSWNYTATPYKAPTYKNG